MNNNEQLIERVKWLQKTIGTIDMEYTEVLQKADAVIDDTITALSPVQDEEVKAIIEQLNKVTNKQPEVIANATAILGRQQHTVIKLQARIAEQEAGFEIYEETCEELTAAMGRWGWQHCDSANEVIAMVDSLLLRIEELEAQMKAYDEVIVRHQKLLLWLSAFDAPEAKTLAATLEIERISIAAMTGESNGN